jgi:hypothetical protein
MKLRIVACQQIYSGLNPKGHRYTIFDIEAAKADGTLINEKLRAFEALPIGETIDVTVTPFESETHGRSFTLHRKGSNNATAHINELKAEVEALAERLGLVEKQLAEMHTAATGPKAGQW